MRWIVYIMILKTEEEVKSERIGKSQAWRGGGEQDRVDSNILTVE